MIENLINGNLKDAKRNAKRFREQTIREHLHFTLGWSKRKSILAAHYLKTGEGFQEYCDAG